MRHYRVLFTLFLIGVQAAADDSPVAYEPEDASADRQARIVELTAAIDGGSDTVSLRSQRGDAYFLEGDFEHAFVDYDRMSEIDPSSLALNWRRGLALHYLERYDEAAEQFERYYVLDKSDRENGIWRYYAHVLAHGEDFAREKLLTYEEGDRAPLPEVYRLCAGELEPQAILDLIAQDDLQGAARDQRTFYGHLYLGMHFVVHDQPDEARGHLELALASEWAKTAGYGPSYMWHIARLQHGLLESPTETSEEPTE
jgi:lipoprotein NlpI